MIALLLPALALAAPALHIEEDSPLGGSASSPPLYELLQSRDGAPRIALTHVGSVSWSALLVPSGDVWQELPMPSGRVMQGPDDVRVLRLAQDGELTPGWLALRDGAWIAEDGPAAPGDAVGPLGLDRSGRLVGAVMVGSEAHLLRGGEIGAKTTTEALYGRIIGGALWWTDATGLRGPKPIARARLQSAEGVAYGLDSGGQPVLAVMDGGGLTVLRAGTSARLSLARGTAFHEESCVHAPCDVTRYQRTVNGRAGIAAWSGGLIVPYAEHVERQQLTCGPFTGQMHPCDPVGRVNTCPDPPQWTCEGPTRTSDDLRAAFVQGTTISDLPLGEALRGGQLSIVDMMPTADGRLHLIVAESRRGTASKLRYVRLGPAELPTVRRAIRAAPGVDLDRLEEATLALSGFVTGYLKGGGLSPAFEDGAVITGGAHGPGWWARELDSVAPSAPVSLEVRLETTGSAACTRPELRLYHNGAMAQLAWAEDGLHLSDVASGDTLQVPDPGPGPHVLGLHSEGGRTRLTLDGREVGAVRVGASYSVELAAFGSYGSCPAGPPPEIRWEGLRLTIGAPAPDPPLTPR